MSDRTEAGFAAMVAATGLPLNAAQIAELREVYPMLQATIARIAAPLPREAEPALIFQAETRGC
jgi:hypothetical protein